VRLTVVGSEAAWASRAAGPSSCYLLEHAGTSIVFDLGQGSFAGLRELLAPESVSAIFISHPHPDHCIDLIPLRHYLRYEAPAAPRAIALHAPPGLPQRFDALFGERDFLGDLPFEELEPGALTIGSIRMTVAAVTHTEGSFAFRAASAEPGAAADGTPLAPGAATAGILYSGDCGDANDLVPLIRAGDTLLAEASFGAEEVPPGVAHLDSAAAARAARDGRAGRLVLTHIQATVDPERALEAARSAWGGETLLARPGLQLGL
jgi:ribonuclease BN (tRNA processing enzyme)